MKAIEILLVIVMATGAAAARGNDGPAGKKVFVGLKCNSCHSVEVAGIPKKANQKLPDLSTIGSKYDAEFLSAFLKKKERTNDKTHIASFKGNEEEVAELPKWLASLKPQKEAEE
jgi:cytochrome c553